MDTRYIMLIMADQRKVTKELNSLRKQFIETKGPVKDLAKQIYLTMKELNSINDEMLLLTHEAFFPYHDMPLLKFFTDEHDNKSPLSGNNSHT